jgi:hypothetical protein
MRVRDSRARLGSRRRLGRRLLLNSPVITDYGTFRLDGPLSLASARSFAAAGVDSGIGHAATAQFLTGRLGVPVAERRLTMRMRPGDRALVFRLLQRMDEGAVLQLADLEDEPYEFALMTRVR